MNFQIDFKFIKDLKHRFVLGDTLLPRYTYIVCYKNNLLRNRKLSVLLNDVTQMNYMYCILKSYSCNKIIQEEEVL